MQHNITVGSLFSGYGGLELGIQHVYPDAQVIWQSEIDEGCQRLLKHHYPNTPNLGDITKIDWHTVPHADIICGGSTCQDMSQAGLRAGMKQGTPPKLHVLRRSRRKPTSVTRILLKPAHMTAQQGTKYYGVYQISVAY